VVAANAWVRRLRRPEGVLAEVGGLARTANAQASSNAFPAGDSGARCNLGKHATNPTLDPATPMPDLLPHVLHAWCSTGRAEWPLCPLPNRSQKRAATKTLRPTAE